MFTHFSFSVKLKTTRTETTTSTMRQTFACGFMFTYCDAHGIQTNLSTASSCFLRTPRCQNPVNTLAISSSCHPEAETIEHFTNTSFLLPIEGRIGQTVPPKPTIRRDARKTCRQSVKDGQRIGKECLQSFKTKTCHLNSHGIRKIMSRWRSDCVNNTRTNSKAKKQP